MTLSNCADWATMLGLLLTCILLWIGKGIKDTSNRYELNEEMNKNRKTILDQLNACKYSIIEDNINDMEIKNQLAKLLRQVEVYDDILRSSDKQEIKKIREEIRKPILNEKSKSIINVSVGHLIGVFITKGVVRNGKAR